jgi:hypothetical protein
MYKYRHNIPQMAKMVKQFWAKYVKYKNKNSEFPKGLFLYLHCTSVVFDRYFSFRKEMFFLVAFYFYLLPLYAHFVLYFCTIQYLSIAVETEIIQFLRPIITELIISYFLQVSEDDKKK